MIYYLNKKYGVFEISQQSNDDLRTLKATAKLSILYKEGKYICFLPEDYLHMLNCMLFFEKNNTCNYKNDFTEIAKKITSISNYATVLKNHSIKTDFFIPLAKFRWTCGDEKCGTPYSLILNPSGKYAKSGWISHLHDTYELFYFNTQSEVDNLKLLFKNTILPKIIGKIFYGKRMPMRHIPLPDYYTSPWTNERLYEYFNLTDDEIKYIEKVVL